MFDCNIYWSNLSLFDGSGTGAGGLLFCGRGGEVLSGRVGAKCLLSEPRSLSAGPREPVAGGSQQPVPTNDCFLSNLTTPRTVVGPSVGSHSFL